MIWTSVSSSALIDNQLATLVPQYDRQKKLFEKKLIAKQDFEKTEADYKYNVLRRKITYEVYRSDSINRIAQIQDFEQFSFQNGAESGRSWKNFR